MNLLNDKRVIPIGRGGGRQLDSECMLRVESQEITGGLYGDCI